MTFWFTQVRVADALYKLLGVTVDNAGEEVLCMPQSWENKNLHIGTNLVAEMDFVSSLPGISPNFGKERFTIL